MTETPRRRPSPAFVVALLALVVALGGTAYAAAKLPKNSVGSAQVQNGSLKTKDLKKGAADPSVFVRSTNSATVPITATILDLTRTSVRTSDLPPGKYYVEATVYVLNTNATSVGEPRCRLVSTGSTLAGGTAGYYEPIPPKTGDVVHRASFQLDAAFSLSSTGTVTVECNKGLSAPPQTIEAAASITATRIGSAKAS